MAERQSLFICDASELTAPRPDGPTSMSAIGLHAVNNNNENFQQLIGLAAVQNLKTSAATRPRRVSRQQ